MLSSDKKWFSEECGECGSAFSLTLKEKLHEETTPFQTIAIYDTETFGKLMTIDGFVMLTTRDNFLYHEMMSHPVLLTHPSPKRVLIIGGGDCGTLREVLRHPGVELAQQVEIDERVTRLAEVHFPELCESNADPRAELHFVDGLKWVADAADGYYDVIIVDSTDPVGPAEGLFGEKFYRNCHRILGAHGLLVHQSESPLFHMKLLTAMHRAMRNAGYQGVQTLHYPQPVYPSGWWSATIARKDGQIDGFREAAAAALPFDTLYYNVGVHKGATALPTFMQKAFDAVAAEFA